MKYVQAATVVGDHRTKNKMWDTEAFWKEVFVNIFLFCFLHLYLAAKLILRTAKSINALEIQLLKLPPLPQLFFLSLQLLSGYMMLLDALRKTLSRTLQIFKVCTLILL